MQSEQKVCEQDVIIGVLKKSLHTWQRRAASTGPSCDTGVCNQSDGSDTSKELSMGRKFVANLAAGRHISFPDAFPKRQGFVLCRRVSARITTDL